MTANPSYIDDQTALLNRVKRLTGQLGGVERMIAEERYCIEILTQIAAIHAALDRVAVGLLESHVRHCILDAGRSDREQRTQEMMGAVERLVRG